MIFTFHYLLLLAFFGAKAARYNIVPKFYAQDSAIIIDTDQPPPPIISSNASSPAVMLPYYQPIQNLPAYKIISKMKPKNSINQHTQAEIFTQEEFPRDLLEIAQQKLGLKTLDEVPSVTELAELLGTNSAAETISYIKQLTSTDQGIALIKAYIESSDYTDSVSNRDNEINDTEEKSNLINPTTVVPEQKLELENITKPGFLERIAAFLNIYTVKSEEKQFMAQALSEKTKIVPTTLKNIRPLYVRSPLPYHYPIPIRPVLINRTNYNTMRMYNHHSIPVPTKLPKSPFSPHLNSIKKFTPAHIQQLARIANIPPKILESFLQRKPKLAELAVKVANFPLTNGNNPMADSHLIAAVHKAIENDEDLRKLINDSDTLK